MDNGAEFSFKGRTPTTMSNVINVLFRDEGTKMMKEGNYTTAFGLIYKWGYYLTMEGCTSTWVEDATAKFITDNGFKVVLGDKSKGIMSSHG